MPEANPHDQYVGDVVPGWETRPAPEPVTLQGRYVRVVPLSSVHYSDLFAAVCGPDDDALWTYRPIAKPASLADLWMHLAGLVELPVDLTFALVPAEGEGADRASGIASYFRIDPRPARSRSRASSSPVRCSGPAPRPRRSTSLMRYAFDDLGYRRFEWKCDSLNEPSRRAARRLGFVYEGRFRNHMVTQGRNRDTDWFSVTAEEWPAVCAAHEAWLDPATSTPTASSGRRCRRPSL